MVPYRVVANRRRTRACPLPQLGMPQGLAQQIASMRPDHKIKGEE